MTHYPKEGDNQSPTNGAVGTGELRALSSLISPDDWRLYHIMRELPGEDRIRVLAFAELLYNLHRAEAWAKGKESRPGPQ